MLFDLMATRMK